MNRKAAELFLKHHLSVIEDYANGAEVQVLQHTGNNNIGGVWVDDPDPSFSPYAMYRIKPEPPDFIIIRNKQTGQIIDAGTPAMVIDSKLYADDEYELIECYAKNG